MKAYLFVTLMLAQLLAWGSLAAEPLDSLQTACRKAGGMEFSPIDGCVCPDKKVFSLDKTSLEGVCKEIKALSEEVACQSVNKCLLGADKIVDPESPRPDLFGSASVLRFGKEEEQKSYLKKLTDLDGRLSVWHPYIDYLGTSQAVFVHKDFKTHFPTAANQILNAFGLREDLLALNRVSNQLTGFPAPHTYYYSADLESLFHMTGLTEGPLPLENAIAAQPSFDNPKQSLIARAFSHLLSQRDELRHLEKWQVLVINGNDCKDVCRMSSDLGEIEGYKITFHQEVLRGMLHKRFVFLTRADKDHEFIVQLTPNLYPSLVLERNFAQNHAIEMSFFDKNGKKLHTQSTVALAKETLDLFTEKKRPLDYGRPRMFLCEGESLESNIGLKGLEDNIFIGEEASAFGWRRYDGSRRDFIRPVSLSPFDTIGPQTDGTGHLSKTALAAKSIVDNVQILPLGFNKCIEDFASWAPQAEQHKVKVHALSRMVFQAKNTQSCQDTILSKVRSEQGREILWVVSAGNDHKENPIEDFCLSSGVRDNVLTVAASDGENAELSAYSNFGLAHADILADGNIQGHQGTSYAAPRIAALAAKIAHEFPNLSAAEIKQAILLGSTPAKSLEGKVRSSAYMNFSDAITSAAIAPIEAAACLVHETSEKRKECLGIRRCPSCPDKWPRYFAKLREENLIAL